MSKKETSIRSLFKKISEPRDRLIIGLIVFAGLTVCEISGLKKKHINDRYITVPAKIAFNSRPRKIRIDSDLQKIIKKHESVGRFLLLSRQSSQMSERRIQQIIAVIGRKLGVHLNQRILKKLNTQEMIEKRRSKETGINSITVKPHIRKLRLRYDSNEDEVAIRLMFETGCRISELVAIKKSDIRKNKIKLSTRWVSISQNLAKKLKSCPGPYLISGKKMLTPRRVQQICKGYYSQQSFSPRILRNSYIYRQLSKKTPVADIKKATGLKNLNIYTHGTVKC